MFGARNREAVWKPNKTKVTVCLLFEQESFPIHSPDKSESLVSASSVPRKKLDLGWSIVDSIRIVSTEINVNKQKNEACNPYFFFLKLYDKNGKIIPHDVVFQQGHPIGESCKAADYFQRTIKDKEERALLDFGSFVQERDGLDVSEALDKKLKLHATSKSVPISERGAQPKFDPEAAQETFSKVRDMFRDIRTISGEICARTVNNAPETEPCETPILVRVVIELTIRAEHDRNIMN